MTDALKKLIEAVEAGRDDSEKWEPALGLDGFGAMMAFHGSLDAALALHDSLLPGWTMDQMNEWHGIEGRPAGWGVNLLRLSEPRMRTHGGGIGMTPARAWLLAILKAKLAEVGE